MAKTKTKTTKPVQKQTRLYNKLQADKIWKYVSVIVPVLIIAFGFLIAAVLYPKPDEGNKVSAPIFNYVYDGDFIAGVNDNAADSMADRNRIFYGNGLSIGTASENILIRHFDPFYVISLCFAAQYVRKYFLVVYAIKYGLASLSMFTFLRKHIKLQNKYAFALGLSYSLSSQMLIASQIDSVAWLAILLPCAVGAINNLIKSINIKNAVSLALMIALVIASGVPGMFFGVFFLAVMLVFLAAGVAEKAKDFWWIVLKALPSYVLGILLSAFAWLPRIKKIKFPEYDIKNMFISGSVNFTFFDRLSRMLVSTTPETTMEIAPAMYIGIFAVVLVILFMLNKVVPLRIKAISIVTIILFHIFSTYSVTETVFSFGTKSSALDAAREMSLACFLFILAAISLKNIKTISSSLIMGASFAVVVVTIIANSSANHVQLSVFTLYGTALSAILIAFYFLYNKENKVFTVIFLSLYIFGSFASTSHALLTANIYPPRFDMYETRDQASATTSFITQNPIGVFGNTANCYVVSDSDLSEAGMKESLPVAINNVSRIMGLDDVFELIDTPELMCDGYTSNGLNRYTTAPGMNRLVLAVDISEMNKPVYVYSSFDIPFKLDEIYDDAKYSTNFEKPVFTKITNPEDSFELEFDIETDVAEMGEISIWQINMFSLNQVLAVTNEFSNGVISLSATDIPGETGRKTVLTSLDYMSGMKAKVNGVNARAFNYYGKLAISFNTNNSDSYEINISKGVPNLPAGIAISVVGIICVIAVYFINKNNLIHRLKKEMPDAEHKDN